MTPTSNSQARLLKLLNASVPSEYSEAAKLLESLNMRSDAIPQGGTWRTAKKLSDAELLAACKAAEWYANRREPVDGSY